MAHLHAHGHLHGAGGHSRASERRTLIAALLTGGFMVAEIVGGLLSGSLALIADAAHMFADTAALGLAWAAFRLARRDGGVRMTYGLRRLPVLVAFGNGITLFVIVLWILVEAIERLADPVDVLAGPMLVVAVAGLLVNVAAFAILHGADRDSLNIRGALLHVAGDLLGSVAAISAAVIIIFTGWYPADPLLSVLVAAIVLVGAWRLTRDAGHILLEGAPSEIDVQEITDDLERTVEGVEDIHHVHVWSLTEQGGMATLHARVRENADGDKVIAAIRDRLKAKFSIDHATVQIESECC